MLENKTCDFCDTKAAVEIDKTFLCAKHYFKLPEESVEVTPNPRSRSQTTGRFCSAKYEPMLD